MPNIAIKAENISKKYRLGIKEHSFSIQDAFFNVFKRKKKIPPFWALKDLNFEVKKGEVLGIIGSNGAGKSTLLKVLTRITPPTTGKISIYGKIASLLEVGTGFHPEFTGRENIFLNGAILGMTHREIKKKFNEIVAFSEIEQFLDTPVKRYSSGMYVRLAFAVAAHLESEILIVDEVLAVGDIAFQKKCLGKMRDAASGGRTVLFVSHNLSAINQLCSRCILIDKGKIIADGDTAKVTKKYLLTNIKEKSHYKQKSDKSKAMNLREVILDPGQVINSNAIPYDEDIVIRIKYEVNQRIENASVWIMIQDLNGVVLFTSVDYDLHPELRSERQIGNYQADVVIPQKWLSPGSYLVVVGLNTNNVDIKVFDRKEALEFTVVDNGSAPKTVNYGSSRAGVLQPYLDWQTKKITKIK